MTPRVILSSKLLIRPSKIINQTLQARALVPVFSTFECATTAIKENRRKIKYFVTDEFNIKYTALILK